MIRMMAMIMTIMLRLLWQYRMILYHANVMLHWASVVAVLASLAAEPLCFCRVQQVERMKDVFSLAERVTIWLDPEANDSNLALSALQTSSLEIRYDWIRETVEPRPGRNPKYADPTIALSYDDMGRTIASIFFIATSAFV